jgi:hypothetical protein
MHHLWIPPVGSIELVHTDDTGEELLTRRTEGTVVRLHFKVDGEPGGVAYCCVSDPPQWANFRASNALAWLCGLNVEFNGPVVFSGVAPELVAELVRDIC